MIKVYVGDKDEWSQDRSEFLDILHWAETHCKSFRGMSVIDVSDVSGTNDLVAEFRFTDDRDVTLFTLRWN